MKASCPPDALLLVSDLHLSEQRPGLTRAFMQFLDTLANGSGGLYVLGDLFDAWIGDDEDSPLATQIAARLRQLSNAGTPVFLMHGNRDFLLGQRYATACGATLLPEPHLLQHGGKRYLLLHGDTLCTRDTDYLAFRAQVRDPAWQAQFLAKPLPERRAFAAEARARSKSMSSNKPEDIMDVTPEAVAATLQEHNVQFLVHGHTHRPAVHVLQVADQPAWRLVLGDWRDTEAKYLRIDSAGAHMERFIYL